MLCHLKVDSIAIKYSGSVLKNKGSIPQEEADMPVFFHIDSEFAEDPKMVTGDLITLSYTFF